MGRDAAVIEGRPLNPFDAARGSPRRSGAGAATPCGGCGARSVGLCALLDAAALDDMAAETERVAVAPRAPLFRQGDGASHVYTLAEGAARLTRVLPDGRQAAIGFRLAGDTMGFTPATEHAFGAETLTRATVCHMDRRRLDAMFRRYPKLERRFLELCAGELAATQDHVLALGRLTAQERVAHFLLSLAESQERRGHRGPVFDLPAMRTDIAELLGLTLETVSRAVSALRKRGWIKLHGLTAFEIAKRPALAALAAGEGGA
ncbi:MAG: helix-turn-helix domain-containing protein [Acetobacteraceae bacterium]|nr:helix-turn-helix domain-containing protein [Acetobacteraceae bacterium]